MKNLIFALSAILTLGFLSSCNKDDNNDLSNNDILVEEIATSFAKQNIAPQDLPDKISSFVADEHFETYIETAAYVESKGYEITLATEDVEYFNNNGDVLRSDRRPHSCYRPGPCGGGERIRIDELPDVVTDYIIENYPDEEIRRAKIKGDYYLVAITGPTVLIFALEDGAFVHDAPLIRFCRGDRINPDNLREEITTYIEENYPDAEIKVAFRVRGKIIVGVITPDGRKILVFSLDGTFLFERP